MLFSLVYVFGGDQSSQPIDLLHGGYTLRLELVTTGQTPSTARSTMDAGAALSAGRIDVDSVFSQVPRAAGAASKKTRTAAKRAAPRPAARRRAK